jgi:hypothetical protein
MADSQGLVNRTILRLLNETLMDKHMNTFFLRAVPAILFFSMWYSVGEAQITISGPQCATPGVLYQYIISGATISGAHIQLCVSGGVIQNDTGACYSGIKTPYVLVLWNNNVSTGSITITGPNSSGNISVSIFQPIDGGAIDSSSILQLLDSTSVPKQIPCSSAGGGSCSPNYSYQWQVSADGISWKDMPNQNGQNFSSSGILQASGYFRRKVTEQTTGLMAYSTTAEVFLVNSATTSLTGQ